MVDENQTLRSMACYSNILIKLAKYQTTRIICQIFDDTSIPKPLTSFSTVYVI